LDIISLSHSKLWGHRAQNIIDQLTEINPETYILSAGTNILVNPKHTSDYEILEVISIDGNSSYPLSSYTENGWGGSGIDNWGLNLPLKSNYNFFEFTINQIENQKEGVINWNDEQTTL